MSNSTSNKTRKGERLHLPDFQHILLLLRFTILDTLFRHVACSKGNQGRRKSAHAPHKFLENGKKVPFSRKNFILAKFMKFFRENGTFIPFSRNLWGTHAPVHSVLPLTPPLITFTTSYTPK